MDIEEDLETYRRQRASKWKPKEQPSGRGIKNFFQRGTINFIDIFDQ